MSSEHPIDPLDLRRVSEDRLLRLVGALRESDAPAERETARRAWNELIERDVERVRALVATWRLPGRPEVRVEIGDRDDAIQHAFYRLLKMLSGFRGSAMPQYRAAMTTCIDWACRDFCRSRMRHERGLGGSLDERLPSQEGDAEGRFDAAVAKLSGRRHADAEAGRERLEALAHAIASLPSDDMRSVLRLTLEGHRSREIADRLDLSVANVDQLRSRGLRRLQPQPGDHAAL